ncbi:MAG: hypothetical protein JO368_03065, partial [Acidimicrobiales bacterium]|nr:hypothetical protein [Acidimicrobiales bacterium]
MSATTLDPAGSPSDATDGHERTAWLSAIPFFGLHLAPLGALFVVVTWQ